MPRIVSGASQQDPNFALMQGMEIGSAYRRARESKAEETRAQQRLMLDIMQARHEHQLEQQKALADVNARAQMGDAQAMQQQMLAAQAANAPPEQKMLQEFAGTLSKLTDPDARRLAISTFQDYAQQLQGQKETQAAQEMLAGAAQDGELFQPEQIQQWQQRLQSGESPQNISQEVMKARHDQASEQHAIEENTAAIEQAQ